MKIIITEQQNEQLNHKIRFAVEKLGLKQSLEMFGKKTIKQAFIGNPLLFLEQFNNLKPVEVDEEIYYVDNDNLPLFSYYKEDQESKDGYYLINYIRVWAFFYNIMDYTHNKTSEIIKDWLDTIYNLSELTPRQTVY